MNANMLFESIQIVWPTRRTLNIEKEMKEKTKTYSIANHYE